MFFSRLVFEPVRIYQNLASVLLERFQASEVMKHSMLSIAFLYRSLYDKAASPAALQVHAEKLHAIASKQLQLDLASPTLPPAVKLSGLMEVLFYEVRVIVILVYCQCNKKLYSIALVDVIHTMGFCSRPGLLSKP
jgi:hypothetical protein